VDNVKAVERWTDGAGVLYETEAAAIQGEARRIIRNIVCQAVNFERRTVDVELLADRRTVFIDALRKIERGG
jgi:hypothetical protein